MEEAEARIRAAKERARRVRARARERAEQQAKRPRRTAPGVKALREIRKYQNRTDLLIPKSRFVKVCKEVLQDNQWVDGQRMSVQAVQALQEAAEGYLTQLFEDSQLAAIHAHRVTLMARDMSLVRRIRHEVFGNNN